MKRSLIIPLAVVMLSALIFTGCAAPSPQPAPTPTPATTPAATPAPSPAPATTPAPAPKPTPAPAPATKPAQVIELTLNLPIAPIHTRWTKVLQPWIAEVEKRTGGQVKIIPYFAEAISPMIDNYASVISGIADMGECTMQMPPNRWPITQNILTCNSPSKLIKETSGLIWDLYKTTPAMQAEFKEVKLLVLHSATPNFISTSKRPLTTLADYKGLKINILGAGFVADKTKTLGISPQQITMADLYMAVERGVVDGSTTNFELMVARKWGDVMKHSAVLATITGMPFYFAMNWNTWNKLPADVQKVIDEMSGDYAVKLFSEYWWGGELGYKAIYEKDMGGKTYFLSDADLAEIDKLALPVVEAFVKDQEAKGVKIREVYDRLRKIESEKAISVNEVYK